MHEILAKGILSAQNGMNLYRGCTHGCIYCDSRSKCYQMDHPFEDVAVKVNAPQLLEKALKSKRAPCMISTGSMSDPYLPLERELGLTRRCLEQILRFGFGAAVLTKSADILRDADLLCQINEKSKCVVEMTLTTWDEALCKKIEPNVSTTQQRLKALAQFQKLGIPTVVWLCRFCPTSTTPAPTCRRFWTPVHRLAFAALFVLAWRDHARRKPGIFLPTARPSFSGYARAVYPQIRAANMNFPATAPICSCSFL